MPSDRHGTAVSTLPGLDYPYEGADGFKTGTIDEAGYCLSATAVKNGRRIISVIMHSDNDRTRHTDSAALLDYGFTSCRLEQAAQAGEAVCSLPVVDSLIPFTAIQAQETLAWPLLEGEVLETELLLDRTALAAPVAAGEAVGEEDSEEGIVEGEDEGDED